jgi:hypothetical protein
MKNYQKSSIYKLVNIFDIEEKYIYIGTTSNWTVRKYQHKRRSRSPLDRGYNNKVYRYIRLFGGFDNWRMIKIEDFPCNNSEELGEREKFLINYYNARLNTYK